MQMIEYHYSGEEVELNKFKWNNLVQKEEAYSNEIWGKKSEFFSSNKHMISVESQSKFDNLRNYRPFYFRNIPNKFQNNLRYEETRPELDNRRFPNNRNWNRFPRQPLNYRPNIRQMRQNYNYNRNNLKENEEYISEPYTEPSYNNPHSHNSNSFLD